MSTSVYVCPTCKQHLEIDREYLGEKVECPTCKHPFIVHHAFLAKDYDHSPSLSAAPFKNWNEHYEAVTEKGKCHNLGNCGLGIASICFIFDIIFGIIAFVYATQALSFVRVNNYEKAKELKDEATSVAGFGIFFGIIFWIIVIVSNAR